MKKNLILLLLFFIGISKLASIAIISEDKVYKLEFEELSQLQTAKIHTIREKNGETKDDNWEGPKLTEILKNFDITSYDKIKLESDDNYLVRLTRQQIVENEPIVAIIKNGKKMAQADIRLIVPKIRDMFWIQGIAKIETEIETTSIFPQTVFIAEKILDEKPLNHKLEFFQEFAGHKFSSLTQEVFPIHKGEFLLIGKDGVRHSLDFDKYLKNAELLKDKDSFHLRSPDMPAGMWIKNIAFIQQNQRGIIFVDRFESWENATEVIGWENLPENCEINDKSFNFKDINNLKNPVWKEAKRIDWK